MYTYYYLLQKYPKEFLCVKYELALMYEQLPFTSNSTRIDHLFKSLHSLLEIGDLLSRLSSLSSSPSFPSSSITFAKQNETLSSTNESGQVKTKIEDLIKQLLKLLSSTPSSSSNSTLSSSPTSFTSQLSQNISILKQLYKDVLSSQSVAGLGKVLVSAKGSIDKML